MNYDYLHPRDEIALTISRIYRNKMTTMSGGNLSILDENGDMWITPAGIDKGTIYLYFRDKDALFQDLIHTMLTPVVGSV